MVFPTVNKCCFCISLTTGCLFLGAISVIVCTFYVGNVLYEIADYLLITPEDEYEIKDFIKLFLNLTFAVIVVLIDALFIYGIKRKEPSLMIYYLIIFGLFTFQAFYAAYDEIDPYVFIFSLIILYTFICIYSLYEKLLQTPRSEIPRAIHMRNNESIVTAL
ncbi:hypothetical protein PVAND_017535 [Polypedilum vanderplanki]|uniref:Uncharacterized protein n=1 Tax=Polypedilum vanderplanki TaxID=319348 RepID=A0A9J6BJB7_POLVA|nr:hypothetical protein PVAND_017535 [Polypedilum vanderplanki]